MNATARPIVFIHGFACDHTDWRFQLEHFKGTNPVHTLDLRGHGATPGRPEDCNIETYGADVARLLADRDLKDALLVGHSMGCRVALQTWLDAPERIGGLALIDGSWLGSNDPEEVERKARATLEQAGFANYAEGMFDAMFLAPSDLSRSIVARAKNLKPEVGLALFPRMWAWDAANTEKTLPTVKVPLLVVQSTYMNPERKRVPMQAGQTIPWLDLARRSVPGARIEVLTGVGHFPQLEVPQRVNQLLSELA